jgi:acetyl-CoA carboxylase biotin carboxyl carrier protein
MADIISPLPGIFYRSPGPGKDPFVEVGQRVEVGQTLGIIEIMKQFTEIQADVAGIVESFSIEEGAMVNPGDVVGVVTPESGA